MTRIKFTFGAGMALLFVGLLAGFYGPSAIGLFARVQVPAELSRAAFFLVMASGFLGALWLIARGTVLPRDWGEG